jgi:hypothetical protein
MEIDNVLATRRKHIAEHHVGDRTQHVHLTVNTVAAFEMTPGHDVRIDTPTYRASHKLLIEKLDQHCIVCGVSNSTLKDPAVNKFNATIMETHHFPIERSLMNACDPTKVHETFPGVVDQVTLEAFIDTPANLIVLCDVHHRSVEQGIHHLLAQDFAVLPYLYDGYQVAASSKECTTIVQKNEEIQKEHHAKTSDSQTT